MVGRSQIDGCSNMIGADEEEWSLSPKLYMELKGPMCTVSLAREKERRQVQSNKKSNKQ